MSNFRKNCSRTMQRRDESYTGGILALAIYLVVLSSYFIYFQRRRRNYRRMARELGSACNSRGLFRTGEISGSSNGRKYAIREKWVVGSSIWTTFSMGCVNKGISFCVEGYFFNRFPNWKYVYAGSHEGEFGTLSIRKGSVPLEEKYHTRIQGLFGELLLLEPELLAKWRNEIRVEREAVSFAMPYVLKNAALARRIIVLLAKVADRIEAQPITQ